MVQVGQRVENIRVMPVLFDVVDKTISVRTIRWIVEIVIETIVIKLFVGVMLVCSNWSYINSISSKLFTNIST